MPKYVNLPVITYRHLIRLSAKMSSITALKMIKSNENSRDKTMSNTKDNLYLVDVTGMNWPTLTKIV